MSRSPLAYPLVRSVDADVGGAADLQTDVMRFMAILALCLVAIFALVQSIPLAPEPVKPVTEPSSEIDAIAPPSVAEPETPAPTTTAVRETPADPAPALAPALPASPVKPTNVVEAVTDTTQDIAPETPPPSAPEEPEGFTLRFESDVALTRLVAAGQVGFYAMSPGRVKRLSVRDSRVSFWDASQPDRFHEMERATVPKAVIDALSRGGMDGTGVRWGVTLPGGLSRELEAIMQEHAGGALVIGADGALRREGA